MLTKLPKAIIFDMDDTSLSDDAVSDSCWEQVCIRFAGRIEELGLAADGQLTEIRSVRRWFWNDPERSRRGGLVLVAARQDILALALDQLGVQAPELIEEIVQVYMSLRADTVLPFPGALDALDALATIKQLEVKLALISNGNAHEQRAKVQRAGLEPLFESILIGGEFGVAKPDPRVFHHTLDQLGIGPEDAWMVGDNLVNDVGGAQAVGIYGVWVDWQGGGLPENSPVTPDRTIRTIVELVN